MLSFFWALLFFLFSTHGFAAAKPQGEVFSHLDSRKIRVRKNSSNHCFKKVQFAKKKQGFSWHNEKVIKSSLYKAKGRKNPQIASNVIKKKRHGNRNDSFFSKAKPVTGGKVSSVKHNVRKKSARIYRRNKSLSRSRRLDFTSSFISQNSQFFSGQLNKRFYFERALLQSNSVYIVDQHDNQAIFDKNSHVIVPIASITKLMTAIVVLDSGLPLNEFLTITNEDRDYEKGTASRLRQGSKLTRADMLHIALMSSENRAASALSRYYPGGRPAFIVAMNRKAQELGMFHTYFKNSTGLSRQNVSTARDLVKLVEAACRYPLIRRYSTDSNYTVNTGKKNLRYNSTNCLVKSNKWDIGVQKTGFINEAGECLVMQAIINSRSIIMVFLNANGKYSRIGDAETVRHWLLAVK